MPGALAWSPHLSRACSFGTVLHKDAIILKFNTAVLTAFGVWYALSGKKKARFPNGAE